MKRFDLSQGFVRIWLKLYLYCKHSISNNESEFNFHGMLVCRLYQTYNAA